MFKNWFGKKDKKCKGPAVENGAEPLAEYERPVAQDDDLYLYAGAGAGTFDRYDVPLQGYPNDPHRPAYETKAESKVFRRPDSSWKNDTPATAPAGEGLDDPIPVAADPRELNLNYQVNSRVIVPSFGKNGITATVKWIGYFKDQHKLKVGLEMDQERPEFGSSGLLGNYEVFTSKPRRSWFEEASKVRPAPQAAIPSAPETEDSDYVGRRIHQEAGHGGGMYATTSPLHNGPTARSTGQHSANTGIYMNTDNDANMGTNSRKLAPVPEKADTVRDAQACYDVPVEGGGQRAGARPKQAAYTNCATDMGHGTYNPTKGTGMYASPEFTQGDVSLADLRLGACVKLTTVHHGVIRWLGERDGRSMVGLEMALPEGSDGQWHGEKLFSCEAGRGLITEIAACGLEMMAPAPEPSLPPPSYKVPASGPSIPPASYKPPAPEPSIPPASYRPPAPGPSIPPASYNVPASGPSSPPASYKPSAPQPSLPRPCYKPPASEPSMPSPPYKAPASESPISPPSYKEATTGLCTASRAQPLVDKGHVSPSTQINPDETDDIHSKPLKSAADVEKFIQSLAKSSTTKPGPSQVASNREACSRQSDTPSTAPRSKPTQGTGRAHNPRTIQPGIAPGSHGPNALHFPFRREVGDSDDLYAPAGGSTSPAYRETRSPPDDTGQFPVVGTRVELKHHPGRYGKVRWIGSKGNQLLAGVEMEEDTISGTTGELSGEKLFDCPPKRALFVSPQSCRTISSRGRIDK